MARVLVDTSAVFALLDRGDACHAAAKRVLDDLRRSRVEPLLTNFVVAECHALLVARLGLPIARSWLLGTAWPTEGVTDADEVRAREIIRQYKDKTFSYTDATSFAVMERLGLRRVFAFDSHFRQFGFDVIGQAS
jgi:predicted nucleic acid-binding protein